MQIMSEDGEEEIRKGSFQKVAFSSAKKLTCDEGELTLTPERLSINCKRSWSRSFSIRDIRLEAWETNLEVYDFGYGKLLFRLIVNDAGEWEKTFRKLTSKYYAEIWKELEERQRKKPEELNKLFEVKPEILGKILGEIRKERLHFGEKNIDFVLKVQGLVETTNDRKLQAFILAHCYIAWYEWTKACFIKFTRGNSGKDQEMMKN
jgi:hypothetical protein